jgi:hypothetical protein
MKWSLINGALPTSQGMALLDELVRTQIRFLEKQITVHSTEEDIKMREKSIKQLQQEYNEIRKQHRQSSQPMNLEIIAHLNE